jgi:hypothetical protein
MTPATLSIGPQTREILTSLAEAILPLQDWIDRKDYVPSNSKELPWRKAGTSLKVSDLRVIEFLELLLRETMGDARLLERWSQVRAEPLKFCPLERPEEWRRARGLDPIPVFDVVGGDNTLTDGQGRQISRGQFYASYLPLLQAAVSARVEAGKQVRAKRLADPAGWKKFALELFTDSCVEWPSNQPDASSFVFQFIRDLLYAVLGMRNPVTEPRRSAILTEIGELRRPGNVFTRVDVEQGLADLKAVLGTYEAIPPPKAEEVPEEEAKVIAEREEALAEAQAEKLPAGAKAHHLEFHQRRL